MALRDLSAGERATYFRGIQPIWGGGLEDGRFQLFQRRLADSPEATDRYRLLGWFDQGRFVSAMKAYDLRAACAGRNLRLLGIGAVFTPPELRRRGYAAAMLRAAMDHYRGLGAHGAVLFSDIDTGYYQRLGFRELESREASVSASSLPRLQGGFRSAMAGDEERMTCAFASGRDGARRLALQRDGWTLRFQLRRLRELARARGVGEPEWGIVVDHRSGEGAAMIRFGRDTVDVLEAAWSSEGARDRLLSGLGDCLRRTGRPRIRFWPAAQLRDLFPALERNSAIAMVASLDERAPLPDAGDAADLALLDHI